MSNTAAENALQSHRQQQSRRNLTSKKIRETRQKLADASGIRPEFRRDLLTICATNELGAALAAPLLATVVAIASLYWGSSPTVLLWLGSIFLTEAALLILCRKFLKDPNSDPDADLWSFRITLAAIVSGIAWGAITLVILPMGQPSADVVIFSTLIVVLCIRTIFGSTVMPFIYASTLPVTTALLCRFLMTESELAWLMAVLAVGVHAYFLFLAHGLKTNVVSTLVLRAEKDELIAEIEEAKAISDRARQHAEDANLAKSRFLATMSHELRTPLNAILGFSEILKEEMFGPHANNTYKQYAHDIHDSGEHLLGVINDILDLSRIEAGRYDLKEEPLKLAESAEDCLRLLRLRAQSKGLTVTEIISDELPKLWAEEKTVRQVFLNLLSNAIKFTPKGGNITIEVGQTEALEQYIQISDNGPGIDTEEIEKVLSPFGQGSLAHETAEGGTGLGLPIVNRLMDLHGGKFVLESELRHGTTATATFPSKRAMQALPPMQIENRKVAKSTQGKIYYEASQNNRSATSKKSVSGLRATLDKQTNKKRAQELELARLEELAYGKKTSEERPQSIEDNPANNVKTEQATPQQLRQLAGEMRTTKTEDSETVVEQDDQLSRNTILAS